MMLQGCSYPPVGWALELVNMVSSIWPLEPPIFYACLPWGHKINTIGMPHTSILCQLLNKLYINTLEKVLFSTEHVRLYFIVAKPTLQTQLLQQYPKYPHSAALS